jgi:hypothetical protein
MPLTAALSRRAYNRNLSLANTLVGRNRIPLGRCMLEDLRVLIQPGAVIAIVLVVLLMAAADLAIIVADKGWPI